MYVPIYSASVEELDSSEMMSAVQEAVVALVDFGMFCKPLHTCTVCHCVI